MSDGEQWRSLDTDGSRCAWLQVCGQATPAGLRWAYREGKNRDCAFTAAVGNIKGAWRRRGTVRGWYHYGGPRGGEFVAGDVYPAGPMRNPNGVQRGSILNMDGDPSTPGYGSTRGAKRLAPSNLVRAFPWCRRLWQCSRTVQNIGGPVPAWMAGAASRSLPVAGTGESAHRRQERRCDEGDAADAERIWLECRNGIPDELVMVGGHRDEVGTRHRRQRQRHREHPRGRALRRRGDEGGHEAEAHDRLRHVGCRRVGTVSSASTLKIVSLMRSAVACQSRCAARGNQFSEKRRDSLSLRAALRDVAAMPDLERGR